MIHRAIDMVRNLIHSWGIHPDEAQLPGQDVWQLMHGSVSFSFSFFDLGEGEFGIEVAASLMGLPHDGDNRYALFEEALRMNDAMVGCWFAVRGEALFLLANRNIAGLDWEELVAMANLVRFNADKYDNILANRFGDWWRR